MKLLLYITCSILLLSANACMERYDDRYYIRDYFVEFEEATTKSKAVGKDYVLSSGSITEDGETLRIQVNLVGAPLESEQVIQVRVVEEETTAEQGKDYQLSSDASIRFAPGSNIAYLEITPGTGGTGSSLLVLELTGNDLIQASENYKQLGIPCTYP